MKHSRLRQCLCEYCTNVELKLKTVNAVAARLSNQCRIRHIYHAADLVTCGRQNGRFRKPCAYGYCPRCSSNNLTKHLQPLAQHRGPVSWLKWENCPTVVNGKNVTRKMLLRKQGTMAELTAELKKEGAFLAGHLFQADWQHSQFEAMRKERPFPAQKVGMVLDFAENFACQYQDEIQAAHWHHAQATVHPIVAYYACPTCGDCMTVSLVFLSDDKTHDFNAVHAFTTLAVQHLRAARGLPVEAVVQWTDGCASQYKSKGPFSDISCAIQDHSCILEHHYFGSRHGKGPSDGESAVVKHHASMAIKTSRAVIKSAKDLFDYCVASALNKQPPEEDDPDCQRPPGEEPKCQHFLPTFFFVKSEDIDRHRNRNVKTVKGKRSLHAVRCLEPNVIQTRELACFCDACRTGMRDCNNTEVVGKWQEQTLTQPGQRAVQPVPQHQQPAPQPPQQQQPVPQPGPQQQQPVPQPGPQQQQPAPQQPVPQQPLEVGTWVQVNYKGHNRTVPFFGKVAEVDLDAGDIKVHYLKYRPDSGTYVWVDESWLPAYHPVIRIDPPALAPGRGAAYYINAV